MPFTAWKHEERNRHRDKKNLFSKFQGVFKTLVRRLVLNEGVEQSGGSWPDCRSNM